MQIGILSPGIMGAGLARSLTNAGHHVVTILKGRGDDSRRRAKAAGMEDCLSAKAFLQQSELVLSVCPPAAALGVARTLADAGIEIDWRGSFVECNAVSPQTTLSASGYFNRSKVTFVDGGIVGMPPGKSLPRLYTSGTQCAMLETLDGAAFSLRYLGPKIGDASAFKMSYAGITKGINALLTTALLSAETHGFFDVFIDELGASQPEYLARAKANVSRLPADSGRWVREMEEISDTFEAVGLPGGFHQGAARLMALLAASQFGGETRETMDKERDMIATIKALAAELPDLG